MFTVALPFLELLELLGDRAETVLEDYDQTCRELLHSHEPKEELLKSSRETTPVSSLCACAVPCTIDTLYPIRRFECQIVYFYKYMFVPLQSVCQLCYPPQFPSTNIRNTYASTDEYSINLPNSLIRHIFFEN